MRLASSLLLTLAVAALGGGCTLDALDPDEGIDPHALVDTAVLWADPGNIPVCWASPGWADEKQLVRSAIASTWSTANPAIEFTGWGACNAQFEGIRIAVQNRQGGPASALGSKSLFYEPSMYLSFDLAGQDEMWKSSLPTVLDPCLESDANRKKCIQAIAIHEFGHALGFEHEQGRSDVPTPCDEDQPYDTGGGWVIDAFDDASIMNYCKKGRILVTSLSAGDKKAVKALYSGTFTQDPGRPTVSFGHADGSPLAPGKEARIRVAYDSFSNIDALPDPETALRVQKDDGAFQTISVGAWQALYGGVYADTTWTLPASDTAYVLTARWNGKYAAEFLVEPPSSQVPTAP